MAIGETAFAVATSASARNLYASVVQRLAKNAAAPAKAAITKTLAALEGYSSYLDETNDRVAMVKTFANPALPVSLGEHFVTTKLSKAKSKKSVTQDDIIDLLIEANSRIVVSATAGHGKSILMKYIALSLYANPRGRIPIFVELRHLNRINTPNLLAYIHASYKATSSVGIEAFRQGLSAGVFVLILDGFDEINHELRTTIESQILELAQSNSKVSLIVSGRPDDKFLSWRVFTNFKILPMEQSQTVELIEKLEYDKNTKRRFISKIKKGLYETHESFLSTPLLAILMLLTFEENANIPDKIHLFYAKAFETLFHKHDAMKEQYDRQRRSGLQIDDFEKVFSVFCLTTYVQEKLEFTRPELLRLIKSAIDYVGIDIDAESMLFDVEEAVCLLQKEGTSFFFVHRSFQEYFTAIFLSLAPEDVRDEFIDQVSVRYWDNVLSMLFDMASDQLEPSWVVRNIDEYLAYVSANGDDNFAMLTARWDSVVFYRTKDKYEIFSLPGGKFTKFIGIMHRFYPNGMKSGITLSWDGLDSLIPRTGVNETLQKMGRETYSIVNVLLERAHIPVLEKCNFMKLVASEYDLIKNIREKIDTQSASRQVFLNKLFAAKATTEAGGL